MYNNFVSIIRKKPQAVAVVRGSRDFPEISGTVYFYQTTKGVVVVSEVTGLPKGDGDCKSPVFAFHIHGGEKCSGNEKDGFADAMTHYNPKNCSHPYHAGDMPPLFGAGGYAFSAFFTDRFSVGKIIGRTVIIHSSPDDFKTQPSGDSGTKIACGEIEAIR